jgi:hypothetical protein
MALTIAEHPGTPVLRELIFCDRREIDGVA